MSTYTPTPVIIRTQPSYKMTHETFLQLSIPWSAGRTRRPAGPTVVPVPSHLVRGQFRQGEHLVPAGHVAAPPVLLYVTHAQPGHPNPHGDILTLATQSVLEIYKRGGGAD
ncbi:hypothetical protein PoB_004453000 [Plakobranchus ocellatus]|uniref:Uncharacterized protein n=1 Tax=Plakobranchus ocellatus TaxID=259542 RepID=A0AAV4BBN4_9GAST|nr:hypothetical protein PoB_004453000 [Plakobranchus ocellatus]